VRGRKSQIQALERTAPGLPLQPGRYARATHDYVRHGTSTLFAALDIATGHVTAACKPRHRRQDFLAFLKQVARACPDQQLHLVMDNYATHKTPEVKAWLVENPRFQVHFTPTSASWLNFVEMWFGTIERQALHRTDVASVAELNKGIRAFVTGWNDRCHPFVWTKTSTEIFKKANRPTTSKTGHQDHRMAATQFSLSVVPDEGLSVRLGRR
jgi:transposase